MKKLVTALFCLALFLPAPAAYSAADGPVTIVFWHSYAGARGEALMRSINAYNESQNRVVVDPQFQGSHSDIAMKLQAAIVCRDQPHVSMLTGSRIKMFADAGALTDMTAHFAAGGLDMDYFFRGFTYQVDYGKGVFGVPFGCSTPLFYYNKDMFREAGLDPERGPANWVELREYARRLSVPDQVWGYNQPIDAWFYESFILQMGAPILNADETDIGFHGEAGTAPLYLWLEMIEEGSMKAPPGQEYNAFEQARLDFASGAAAMILNSSGDLAAINVMTPFEVGTDFLPAGTQHGTAGGGAHLVAPSGNERDMEAIVDFLYFMTRGEIAGKFASETGFIPTSQAAADSEAYQTFLEEVPNARAAFEQMQYAVIIPVHEHYSEISFDIMMSEIQRVIFEYPNYTPEMAVESMSQRTRALLGN